MNRIVVSAPALALARLITPPNPLPVDLRALGDRIGYAPRTTRYALRELAELGAVRLDRVNGDPRRTITAAVAIEGHWLWTAATQAGGES